MALHLFKALGGAGGIADDSGGTGSAIFDDVTFNGTTGEQRESGFFCRNNDAPALQYQSIVISIFDGEPSTQIQSTNFKLATTPGGLGAAVPGASLSLPNLSGISEIQFFIRCTINPGTTVNNYTGIKVVISAVELAV